MSKLLTKRRAAAPTDFTDANGCVKVDFISACDGCGGPLTDPDECLCPKCKGPKKAATKQASGYSQVADDLKRLGAKDVAEDPEGGMTGWLPTRLSDNAPPMDGDEYHFEFSGRTESKDDEPCSEFFLYPNEDSAFTSEEDPEFTMDDKMASGPTSPTPEGWEPFDPNEYDGDPLNFNGLKPYNSVFTKSEHSADGVRYDLSIVFDGQTYFPVHGAVVMSDIPCTTADEAAFAAEEWYGTEAKMNASEDLNPEALDAPKGAAAAPPADTPPAIVAPAADGGVTATAPQGSDALKDAVWAVFQKEIGSVSRATAETSYPGTYQAYQQVLKRLAPMGAKFITKDPSGSKFTCTLPAGLMPTLKPVISQGLHNDKALGSGQPSAHNTTDGISTETSTDSNGGTTSTTREQRSTDVTFDGRPQWLKDREDKKSSKQASKRVVKRVPGIKGEVKVYYDSDLEEYSAILNNDEKSTYFTDDKQDALDTAERMVGSPSKSTTASAQKSASRLQVGDVITCSECGEPLYSDHSKAKAPASSYDNTVCDQCADTLERKPEDTESEQDDSRRSL